ncbi:MAG TPA: pilus assembly protein TadG-related protein [Gemmatimonadota bacterium]|nr:pilus assembly protein TadG-related protein [Gemmatimonadota bacterium]
MSPKASSDDRAGRERGATIVFVALAITALLSVVALAIDVGMLLTAKTEAQRTADAAAMAGAGTLLFSPDDDGPARSEADKFGDMNKIQGVADIDPADDVDVDLVNLTVTVRAHRDQVRGGPVATWFAQIFGVDAVDVGADATARIVPAGAATCLKPFSIYDRFDSNDGNDTFDEGVDVYDPHLTGYGSSWRNPGEPGDDGLGYINDFGRPIVVKGNAKQGDPCCPGTGPSWYYPWVIPGGIGGRWFRDNIAVCNPEIISVGEEHDVEPGNMHGNVVKGVEALIAQDPLASWDTATNQVVGSAFDPWVGSPRIGIVPTFHPGRSFRPGRKPLVFMNFIAVYFESVSGKGNDQQVHARILYATGLAGGSETAPGAKAVQLIE